MIIIKTRRGGEKRGKGKKKKAKKKTKANTYHSINKSKIQHKNYIANQNKSITTLKNNSGTMCLY